MKFQNGDSSSKYIIKKENFFRYETDAVSEVAKGHHAIYKVVFTYSIESFKKSRSTATLLLSIFANIDKSNVAVERLFFKLSMDPLVGNDSPISKF